MPFKRYTAILVFFLLYNTISWAQVKHEKYILALSVDFYMNTSYRISCNDFVTVFDKVLTINTVSDDDSVEVFLKFIHKIKYLKVNRNIDVRSKYIYEIDSLNTITVCTDGRNILVNGRIIKRNKRFIKFLNSIIYRHV
jgi:hypothetical protein